MRTRTTGLIFLALLAVLIACTQPGDPAVSVSLNDTEVTLNTGEQFDFTATVSNASDTDVSWSLDPEGFGEVIGEGNSITYLAPLEAGTATLTATSVEDSSKSASATISIISSETNSIRFVSDQSLALTAQGQEAELEVEVIGPDGLPIADAVVDFVSDKPGLVSVASSGNLSASVRAEADPTGFATITASYQDLEVKGTVLLAVPSENTNLISSSLVQVRTEDSATLNRTPETAAYKVGDILVSGSNAGILSEITNVEVQDNTVILGLARSNLAAAFEEFQVVAEGETVELTAELVQPNTAILTARSSSGRIISQSVLDDVKCEVDGGANVGFTLTGGSITTTRTITPVVTIEKDSVKGWRFAVEFTGAVGINATTGSLSFATEMDGQITCNLEFKPFSFKPVTAYVFFFYFSLTPSIGVDIGAEIKGPNFNISGPKGSVTATVTAGFEYSVNNGLANIASSNLSGTFEAFGADFNAKTEFGMGAEPYVKLDAGIRAFVGPEELDLDILRLLDVRLLELKGYGRATLEMASPFSEIDKDYLGPQWVVGVGASSELKAEINSGSLVDLIKEISGRDFSGKFASLNLFNVFKELLTSARIEAMTLPRFVSPGQEIRLIAESKDLPDNGGLGPELKGVVNFYLSKDDGDLVLVNETPVPINGRQASFPWTPTAEDTGVYGLYARYVGDNDPISKLLAAGHSQSDAAFFTVGGDVAVSPPRQVITMSIGQMTQLNFSLINRGEAIDFEASGEGVVKDLNVTSGSLAMGESARNTYSVTCPEQETVLTGVVNFSYSRNGQPVTSGVPATLPVTVTCVDYSENGGYGKSYGDPHLVTPDGRFLTFMVTGDYVMSRSTQPGDSYVVQTRYRPFDSGGRFWSANDGVAANVNGDIVVFYATETGKPRLFVNGSERLWEATVFQERLPGGGEINYRGFYAWVDWPDGTHLQLVMRENSMGAVQLTVPPERAGKTEGLMGNFDGDRSNDLQLRDGTILNNPSQEELYTTYRDAWRVPFESPENLFNLGPDLFDPSYPPDIFGIEDFSDTEIAAAQTVCEAAGVVTPEILEPCILDVLVTGDESWADIAAISDPNVARIDISPPTAFLFEGRSETFEARVSGTIDRAVSWQVDGGTLAINNGSAIYTAPAVNDIFTITATLDADPSVTASATIFVTEAGPPLVDISSPVLDAHFSSDVPVEGTASHIDGISRLIYQLNDGPEQQLTLPLVNDRFSFTLDQSTLLAGANTVSVSAFDILGESGSDAVSFVYDNTAPLVDISSPEEGQSFTGGPITVTGTATDNDAVTGLSYSLNGSEGQDILATLSDGQFSFEIPATPRSLGTANLVDGDNTIIVTASDRFAAETSATRNITIQDEPPEVMISSPTSGQVLDCPDHIVTGTVSDDVGISGLSYRIDGGVEQDGNAFLDNGVFAIPIEGLAEGDHSVTVIAVDSKAQQTTVSVNFSVDDIAPEVSITSPANNAPVASDEILVRGTAVDKVGVTRLTASLNGGAAQDVTSSLSGEDFGVAISGLSEGQNTIVVTAFDVQEQMASDSVTVVYDPNGNPVTPVIFVYGDFHMFDGMGLANAGNLNLLQNLYALGYGGQRADANTVWLDLTHGSLCLGGACTLEPMMQVAGQLGLDAFIIDNPFNVVPPEVRTLVLMLPTQPYSPEDIFMLVEFAVEGGRLIFIAEDGSNYQQGYQNVFDPLMAQLGIEVQPLGGQLDCANSNNYIELSGASIQPFAINDGVDTLLVNCAGNFDIIGGLTSPALRLLLDSQLSSVIAFVVPIQSSQ